MFENTVATWKRSSRRSRAHLKSKEERVKAWNPSEKSRILNGSSSFSHSCQKKIFFCEVLVIKFLGTDQKKKNLTTETKGRNCKTGKRSIPSSEKTYMCLSCNCQMHLTPECTALSTAAISGNKELGVNVMLLCNKCVENNERDNFIRGRALASVSEKLSTFDVGDKLKNMDKILTDLVD